MSDTQQVVVIGKRLPVSDDVLLLIGGVKYGGWTSVSISRGIEFCPNHFELGFTDEPPNEGLATAIVPGQICQLFIGPTLVITGYINRVTRNISATEHNLVVTGRGKCQDLVDCAATWPGQQIISSSVLGVAQKLAEYFGITVSGDSGPPVGQGGKGAVIPVLVLLLGETSWEIIDRLCRIAGLLAYELPDGNLFLTFNPVDQAERSLRETGGSRLGASSGFKQGFNILSASSTFADDQKYGSYQAFRFSLAPLRDYKTDQEANLIAEYKDNSVVRFRPRIIIMEMNKAQGEQNAADRAAWEAARRWGRGQMVRVKTDNWRDSAGQLYEPNTLVDVEIPSININGKSWLISEVTYHKSEGGTECDLVIMPPESFAVQPTLPPQQVPADFARGIQR